MFSSSLRLQHTGGFGQHVDQFAANLPGSVSGVSARAVSGDSSLNSLILLLVLLLVLLLLQSFSRCFLRIAFDWSIYRRSKVNGVAWQQWLGAENNGSRSQVSLVLQLGLCPGLCLFSVLIVSSSCESRIFSLTLTIFSQCFLAGQVDWLIWSACALLCCTTCMKSVRLSAAS